MKIKKFNEEYEKSVEDIEGQSPNHEWKEYNNEIKGRFGEISRNSEIILESISTVVNRTLGQTKFLFVLCEMDIYKYMILEEKIKNNFISYCPVDKKTIDEIISIKKDKSNFFKFGGKK